MAKKIVITSNFSKLASGFAKNVRVLLSHLHSRKNSDGSKKWECIEIAQGMKEGDVRLKGMPWKCYGGMPADEASATIGQPRDNNGNFDPNLGRMVGYGAAMIEPILKLEKPNIFWAIEDYWGMVVLRKYSNRPYVPYWDTEWWDKFNTIAQSPLDSLPFSQSLLDGVSKSKHFFVKSSFAQKELHKLGHTHVGLWPCLMDAKEFRVFSDEEKKQTRKKYGIDEDCLLFGIVSRNQNRKKMVECINAFKLFKDRNPKVKAKFVFVTSTQEGWDLKTATKNAGLDREDILCSHICHSCNSTVLKAIEEAEGECPVCGTAKALKSISIEKGISEKDLVEIYNILDGYVAPMCSGGFELTILEASLTALYTSTIDYAYGEMFIESGFVFPIQHIFQTEIGSLFKKAVPIQSSICDFMEEIYKNPEECREKGLKFREWAMNTIHPDLTLKKIEDYLDSLPDHGYDFSFKTEWPDLDAPFSNQTEDSQWIIETYKLFFGVNLTPEDKNYQAMQAELSNGTTREQVYQKCRQIAETELKKRGQIKTDPESFFKQDGKKRLLYSMAGDYGDSLISLPVLEELRKLYPADEWGLYIECIPTYQEIYAHLDWIDGFIPWTGNQPFEMWEGARGQKKLVDVVIAPQLNRSYIHNGVDLNQFHPAPAKSE